MEEDTRIQCQKLIRQNVLSRSFIPYYEVMKKYQGTWSTDRKILFPGYVFLISDTPEELFLELKQVIGLTKLLKTGDEIIALTEEEITLLLRLGREEQIAKMSAGFIENDSVIVTSGPLNGMEGLIKKIDRHKRKAYLEVEMFGRKTQMQLGLEIIEKR